MAKKFRGDYASGEGATGTSLDVALSEWVNTNAPDIVGSLSCMKSVPAVEYFARLFEKERKSESKRPGKNGGVDWPYADRLIYLARKFRSLSDDHKNLVITARIENIFWRGDDHDRFNTIVTETILYRDLNPIEKANYKKRLMTVASSLGSRHAMF